MFVDPSAVQRFIATRVVPEHFYLSEDEIKAELAKDIGLYMLSHGLIEIKREEPPELYGPISKSVRLSATAVVIIPEAIDSVVFVPREGDTK